MPTKAKGLCPVAKKPCSQHKWHFLRSRYENRKPNFCWTEFLQKGTITTRELEITPKHSPQKTELTAPWLIPAVSHCLDWSGVILACWIPPAVHFKLPEWTSGMVGRLLQNKIVYKIVVVILYDVIDTSFIHGAFWRLGARMNADLDWFKFATYN